MSAKIYRSPVSRFASAFPESKFYKRDRSSDREIYRQSRRNGAKRQAHKCALKHRKSKAWKVWESCAEKIVDFVSCTHIQIYV